MDTLGHLRHENFAGKFERMISTLTGSGIRSRQCSKTACLRQNHRREFFSEYPRRKGDNDDTHYLSWVQPTFPYLDRRRSCDPKTEILAASEYSCSNLLFPDEPPSKFKQSTCGSRVDGSAPPLRMCARAHAQMGASVDNDVILRTCVSCAPAYRAHLHIGKRGIARA